MTQHSGRTVGLLAHAALFLCNLPAVTSYFSILIGPKMQLNGWDAIE